MPSHPRFPGSLTLWPLALAVVCAAPGAAQGTGAVAGRVAMQERDDRPSRDLSQAVAWLSGPAAPVGPPAPAELATEGKQFVPRLAVVAQGATVAFPNHDPFNHNVFSLSREGPFDLGLYGRGASRTATFPREGVIRVYCNVHAQMRGLIIVLETALHTQPGSDGSFRISDVPPGDYVLHVWHERAPEVTQPLTVTARTTVEVSVELDARGYRFVQHRDKHGRPYSAGGRRY